MKVYIWTVLSALEDRDQVNILIYSCSSNQVRLEVVNQVGLVQKAKTVVTDYLAIEGL